MGDRERTFRRLHRICTLQLNLSRADEARAHGRVASEAALAGRIAQLADAIAPSPSVDEGFSFLAAAHFRDRLHQSAEAAAGRVRAAEAVWEKAADAAREAKRDQTAVEKLIARAEADEALRAIRALEAAPPVRKIRHDPC